MPAVSGPQGSSFAAPVALFERYRLGLNTALRTGVPSNDIPLYNVLRYHLGWTDEHGQAADGSTGKALRPLLCLFTCEAVGGQAAHAMPAAVSLELVHNFSLIHDDLQDDDRERRHQPTVWVTWGRPRALVAGNALCTIADIALEDLVRHGVPSEKALTAYSYLTTQYLEMIEGQYLDLSFEGNPRITQADYLDMIGRKTGALMEAATHLGAYLGTDDEATIRSLAHCGRLLGLAFQIRDDVLGIWGDEEVTGKAAGADLRKQKRSLPMVHALEVSSGQQQKRLRTLASQPHVDEVAVQEMLRILEDVGAREFAQKLAQQKGAEAVAYAQEARLPRWAQQELEDLVEYVLVRQR